MRLCSLQVLNSIQSVRRVRIDPVACVCVRVCVLKKRVKGGELRLTRRRDAVT